MKRPTADVTRATLALLLLLPVPTIGTAAASFWSPGTALGQGLFIACKLWVLVLPVVWRVAVEKRPLSWSPPRRGGFLPATLVGLAIAGVIALVYLSARWFGWIDPEQVAARAEQTGLNKPAVYLLGAVYWIALNSLLEEYVWRWFCFRQCEILFGGVGGVPAAALGFTLHHVVALAAQFSWPMTLLGSVGVFTGGAIWSWLYLRYRSVWPCFLSHAIADLPIFAIGYLLIFG
jgi:membrane protease YdiL (CAAX protease family)